MYSVVLLMAMSGAPDTPAGLFHKNRGCDGGCQGYAAACYGGGGGCYGGGGGCYGGGGGCHGGDACYGGGGGCHGGRGGLFHKRGGGCHGGGGCNGGCQGYVASGCGCGPVMTGCYGGGGGCYGGMGGCYGGMGGAVVPMAPGGTGTAPATMPKPPTTGGGTTPPVAGGGLPVAYSVAPATLVVTLPEDANLKIDGTATKATSGVRQFTTPALVRGQSYYYTLTAEIVRDGKTYAATQTVTVSAGQTSQVQMSATAFGMAVAAK